MRIDDVTPTVEVSTLALPGLMQSVSGKARSMRTSGKPPRNRGRRTVRERSLAGASRRPSTRWETKSSTYSRS